MFRPVSIEDLLEYDWKIFDEIASCNLNALRWVAFGFRSLEDVKNFADSIAIPYMSNLSTTDKIRYAMWNGEDDERSRWVAVAPGLQERGS